MTILVVDRPDPPTTSWPSSSSSTTTEARRRRRARRLGQPRRRCRTWREEVAQQVVAADGEDRLGVELHALDGELAMAQAHDVPSSVSAVISSTSGTDARSTTSEW